MKTFDPQITKILMKTMSLGLFMNTLGPVALLIIAVMATGDSLNLQGGVTLPESSGMQTLFYALLGISIAAAIVTYLLKKRMFQNSTCPDGINPQQYFEERVWAITLIIYSFNLSHSFYGLVLYLVGFPIEIMMLFVAMTLITYQFYRPRPGFLTEFHVRITGKSEQIQ
ncbi:MAG: hypothetical protein KAR42_14585 [candidate division Zixibacteria bacterium]|nr:hypothetical protein [candidate division Zixibacteria bacterium]